MRNPTYVYLYLWKSLKKEKKFKATNLPSKYHHLLFDFMDLNDSNMIYALLQCSDFNRKFHPYGRCTYARGLKVSCKLLSYDYYSKLYRKSDQHFDSSLKKLKVKNISELDNVKFKK